MGKKYSIKKGHFVFYCENLVEYLNLHVDWITIFTNLHSWTLQRYWKHNIVGKNNISPQIELIKNPLRGE